MTKNAKPYRRALTIATSVLLGGIAASVAGNLQAINLDNAAPGVGAYISATFWPLLLLGMTEMMLHTPWVRSWRDGLTRWVAMVGIAAVALYVSYGHLVTVLLAYGYDWLAAHTGPLAVDLGMAAAALAINRVGQRRREEGVSTPASAMSASVPLDTLEDLRPVYSHEGDGSWTQDSASTSPVDMPSASIWVRLDSEHGADDPTLPVPVSPAPAGRVRPDNVPASAREAIEAWLSADPSARPSGADVDKIIAGDTGKHVRTVRGWRKALEADSAAPAYREL